jgi:hypothetical protein
MALHGVVNDRVEVVLHMLCNTLVLEGVKSSHAALHRTLIIFCKFVMVSICWNLYGSGDIHCLFWVLRTRSIFAH